MSKQSKQERARKYADGARETVRLADLAADEVKLDLKAIRSSVEAVHDRLDNLAGWNKAAVAEAEEIKAILIEQAAREVSMVKQLVELEARVEGAKSTLKQTAEKIGMVMAEVESETAEAVAS